MRGIARRNLCFAPRNAEEFANPAVFFATIYAAVGPFHSCAWSPAQKWRFSFCFIIL